MTNVTATVLLGDWHNTDVWVYHHNPKAILTVNSENVKYWKREPSGLIGVVF